MPCIYCGNEWSNPNPNCYCMEIKPLEINDMFRVHFDIDGERRSVVVRAENPDKAAASVRRDYPGAFVVKVKVDKS